MARYVAGRVAWTVVVLWAVVTLTFGATFLSPIDPARSYSGMRAPEEVVERVRQEFGLNEPVWTQYGRYLKRLVQGDLGISIANDASVLDAILDRFPSTAVLALAAAIVQLSLGIPLGIAAALTQRSALDRAVLWVSLLGIVTPTFVLGFLLLYFLAFQLELFPLGGGSSFHALILPALTIGVPGAAWYARMLRSALLNILGEDYVRLARAKGLPERVVVLRHVLRNALGPIVVMIGIDLGTLLGGVLVIERVFAWPGIGDQAWRAITFNDVPMVMGTVIFAAFFVTLFNLLADLVNAALDPRIRYG